MTQLGIKNVEFHGSRTVNGVKVLGKGCVGIVVLTHTNAGKVALKIRRLDADRDDMSLEGEMLKIANQLMIGPKLLGLSDNFLLMEYIEGSLLPAWISKNSKRKKIIKQVLKDLLFDCFKLDTRKLDHGELSSASKHVIVKSNDVPVIVDFESSSFNRKPKNVQCMCQYLFLSSRISEVVNRIFEVKEINSLIKALKIFKKNQNRENFSRILAVMDLA